MPKFRITAPNGKSYEVTAPDGATQDQVMSYVQSQHAPAPPRGFVTQSPPHRAPQGPDSLIGNAIGQSREQMKAYGAGPLLAGEDMLRAGAHNVASQVIGLGQFIHSGVTAAADALLPAPAQNLSGLITGQQPKATGLARVRQVIDNIDQRAPAVLAKREADYQANVPDNAASYVGAAAGQVLPWMTGIGELRAAGMLPQIAEASPGFLSKAATLFKKGGLLALEGGAMGAAAPVTEEGSYAGHKAIQIGVGAAAAPLLAAGLHGTGSLGRGAASASRFVTPSGRESIANERVARLLGDSPEVIDKLRQGSGIAGYEHTPAQLLATPEAVQAERVLRNNGQTAPAFAGRESANNAALREHTAKVAGTDAELQSAIDARRSGPGAFWKETMPRGAENGRYGRAANVLSDFQKSRSMPSTEYKVLDEARRIAMRVQKGTMDQAEGDAAIRALTPKHRASQKAMDQALGMIDNGMVNPGRIIQTLQGLSKDTNPTISKAADGAIAALAKNQDGQGWVHARVLDGLRQNFGKLLADNAPHGAVGSAEGAVYGPLKAKITNTIERAIPGYRNNLASYASHSRPVNDMEAGRALLAAIDSGGRDAGGNQVVSLAQVKSLIAKDNHANFPMSAQARGEIEKVLTAVQRRTISSNSIAAAGPGTAADVQRAISSSPLLMRVLGHVASIGGGVTLGPFGYLAGAGAVEGVNALNNSVVRKVGIKAADSKLAASAIESNNQRLMMQRKPPTTLLDAMKIYQTQKSIPHRGAP